MASSSFRQSCKRRYVCQYCTDQLHFTTEEVVCPTCSAKTVDILDVRDLERICSNIVPTIDPVPVPDVPRPIARPVRRRVSNPVPGPVSESASVPENQDEKEVVCPKCMFRMLGFKYNHYAHVHPSSQETADESPDDDSDAEETTETYEELEARFEGLPPTVTGVDVYFRQDEDVSSIIIGFSRGHVLDPTKRSKLAMSENQIDQVPEVTISNELLAIAQQCPICLEDLVIGEDGLKLFCDHIFHKHCLLPWLRKRNMCPVCRSNQSHLADRYVLDRSRNSLMSMVNDFIENFDGPVNIERREIKVPLSKLVRGRQASDDESDPGSPNATIISLTTSDEVSSATASSDDEYTDEEITDDESD